MLALTPGPGVSPLGPGQGIAQRFALNAAPPGLRTSAPFAGYEIPVPLLTDLEMVYYMVTLGGDSVTTARLYRTEGIVMRRRDQGEADRVLTLCTPTGKTDVIAKGARKVRSRKAGHVELFARSSFVVSRVQNSWDIVSQAEMIEPYVRLRGDLIRGTYARYAVELLDGFFAQEEGGAALYDLLCRSLGWMCEHDDLDEVARFYEQHLLGLAGFRPELFRCVGNHSQAQQLRIEEQLRDGRPFGLDSVRGGCLCYSCYMGTQPLQGVIAVAPQVLSYLREMQKGPFSRVIRLPASPPVREGAERSMHTYIAHHLERNVKSIAFLRQLRGDVGRVPNGATAKPQGSA